MGMVNDGKSSTMNSAYAVPRATGTISCSDSAPTVFIRIEMLLAKPRMLSTDLKMLRL